MQRKPIKKTTTLKKKTSLKKTAAIPKTPKAPIPKLKRKADKVFSLATRLRDADQHGMAECITCNKKLHYKKGHAGHFMSRRKLNTRWEEENVNFQCAGCNTYGFGEQFKYGLAIDLKYGNGTAKKLQEMSEEPLEVATSVPKMREFLEDIIDDSEEQIRFYTKHLEE